MRGVPWWGVISSAAAPVLLAGGWTVAARLQSRFDPVAGTVSALAAPGAADRWVMTATFVVVGVCYLVTALALRPAGTAGRLILIAGAVAGMLVAANPERAGDAYPWGHIIWASIGLAGVTAWPAGAWRRGSAVPWSLRPTAAAAAVAVMLALVIWFAVELITGSGQAGLAERAAGIAQALWPLVVVLSCRRPASAASDTLPQPAAAGPGTRPGPDLMGARMRRGRAGPFALARIAASERRAVPAARHAAAIGKISDRVEFLCSYSTHFFRKDARGGSRAAPGPANAPAARYLHPHCPGRGPPGKRQPVRAPI